MYDERKEEKGDGMMWRDGANDFWRLKVIDATAIRHRGATL